jgi:hypothetical protein
LLPFSRFFSHQGDKVCASNLLVDPLPKNAKLKALVFLTGMPELHWAQTGVGSILDVLAK